MPDTILHRLELPNPFFEGRTNAYLIPAEPVTLIDCGIGTEDSFQALEQGLHRYGLAIADVRQIVLTHHHMDHFGQAWRVRELSGATVHVHRDDLVAVTRYNELLPEFIRLLHTLLERAGVPAVEVARVIALYQAGAGQLARSVAAEPFEEGTRLAAGGGTLEVIHTPGHTLGSICLRYGQFLFSGDHVLPGITPNIGSELSGTGLLRRYLTSLERVKQLQQPGLTVLPGHGEPFGDLAARADALLAHHERRERQLLDLVRGHGPSSIYELATRMFGRLEGYHIVLGAAEVWAHLEKLIEEGHVTQRDTRFST